MSFSRSTWLMDVAFGLAIGVAGSAIAQLGIPMCMKSDSDAGLATLANNEGDVEQLDPNGKRVRLCFLPRGGLPVGDIMLAQKIALELFESEAVEVANGSLAWVPIFQEELRLRRQRRR